MKPTASSKFSQKLHNPSINNDSNRFIEWTIGETWIINIELFQLKANELFQFQKVKTSHETLFKHNVKRDEKSKNSKILHTSKLAIMQENVILELHLKESIETSSSVDEKSASSCKLSETLQNALISNDNNQFMQ